MPARLTLHYPSHPAHTVYLDEDQGCVLGRADDCDVVVMDDRVSRQHARLSPADDGWTVEDLDSKNGTTVDGQRATGMHLDGEHWICLGGLLGHFEVVSDDVRQRAASTRVSRWQTTVQLQRRLDPAIGLPALLDRTVQAVLDLTGAERGFVLLPDDDGELGVTAHAGITLSDLHAPEFSGSIGAVDRVLANGQPVVASDVLLEEELGHRPSIADARIRALVCIPLTAADRTGVIYADSRQPGKGFDDLDLEILGAFASQAGMAASIALVDRKLAHLAEELPGWKGIESATAAELARELEGLVAGRPAGAERPLRETVVGSSTRWRDLVTHHRR